MRKQLFSIIAALTITGCADAGHAQAKKTPAPHTSNTTGYLKTKGGLEYKILKKGTGTYAPRIGDYAEMSIVYQVGDSVLFNSATANEGKPIPNYFHAPEFKGDLSEGLLLLKEGDSAVFRMKVDTLISRTKDLQHKFLKPQSSKEGDYALWYVKMFIIRNKVQMEQEQAAKDDQLIRDYLTAHNLKALKTGSGLYYILTPGSDTTRPVTGQKISLNYTGQFLNGEKFDSNTDSAFHHVMPLNYTYGKDHMIKGWDEGVSLMHKGDKITILVPSALGYGAFGRPPAVPANSVLMFDMELLDIAQ